MGEIKIPFFLWGGNQDLNVKLIHTHLKLNELRFMIEWAKKWGDIHEFGSFIEKGGISWLDIAVPESDYRLHLIPYFSRTGKERPSFYYLGAFIRKNEMVVFGNYLNLLEPLHALTLRDVKSKHGQDAFLTVTNKIAKINDAPDKVEEPNKIEGIVLKGDYKGILARLRFFFNAESKISSYEGLAIACNPPERDEAFTTILITSDFYNQGMKIVKKPTELPPQTVPLSEIKKSPGLTPMPPQKRRKITNLKIAATLVLAGTAIAASIFLVHEGYLSNVFPGRATEEIIELPNLTDFILKTPSHKNQISLSFAQIEVITGRKLPLPQRNAAWWNTTAKNRDGRQAKMWRSAGFSVHAVEIDGGYVEFQRIKNN